MAIREYEHKVSTIPVCDVHRCGEPAKYTSINADEEWNNYCDEHFKLHGFGLGEGLGYKLVLDKTPPPQKPKAFVDGKELQLPCELSFNIDLDECVSYKPNEKPLYEHTHLPPGIEAFKPLAESTPDDAYDMDAELSKHNKLEAVQKAFYNKYSGIITKPDRTPVIQRDPNVVDVAPPTTQICMHCKEEKPLDAFSLSSYDRSKHVSTCKQCQARRRGELRNNKQATQRTLAYTMLNTKYLQLCSANNTKAQSKKLAKELQILIDRFVSKL